MREPWKILYDCSDRARPAGGAVNPIMLAKRIRIRVKAVFLQPMLRGGKRARGRISS